MLLHGLLDDRAQTIAFALATDDPQRAFNQVVAYDDHDVAREKLHAVAMRREEGTLYSGKSRGPVDRDA